MMRLRYKWVRNGGVAMLAMLLACGCSGGGSSAEMAQADRMPAPADVVSQGDAAASDYVSQSGNMPDSAAALLAGQKGDDAPGMDSNLAAAAIDLDTALREIAALDAPVDVDADVFAELKAELKRLLGEDQAMLELVREEQVMHESYMALDKEIDASMAGDHQSPDPASGAGRQATVTGQSEKYYDSDGSYLTCFMSRPALSFMSDSGAITVAYSGAADYDSNGIVNAADLVPLAANLHANTQDKPSLAIIDGDRNGIISVADIVPIARHFGERTTEMRLYGSMDIGSYPWDEFAPWQAEPLAVLPLSAASRDGKSGRLASFSFTDYQRQPGMYYWAATDTAIRPSQLGFDRRAAQLCRFSRLRYDNATGWLQWDYSQLGDINRSFYWDLNDISWLSVYAFQEYVPGEELFMQSMDFNEDGHTAIAELAIMGLTIGMQALSLNFYMSLDAELTPAALPLESEPQPFLTVPIEDAEFRNLQEGFESLDATLREQYGMYYYQGSKPDSFLWCGRYLPDLPSGARLWIRPLIKPNWNEEPVVGLPSEVIRIP